MEGGDANPYERRNLIGKPPMFKYPTKQTPDPDAAGPNHGIQTEEEDAGANIDKAAIEASKAARANEAAKEKKAEDAAAAAAKGALA